MDKFVTRSKRKATDDSEKNKPDKALKADQYGSELKCTSSANLLVSQSSESSDVRKRNMKRISAENLNCDYTILFDRQEADRLLNECEKSLQYYEGDLARVHVYGKWHNLSRKQVAHGDPGLTYRFSGICLPAKPWIPFLENIRDQITELTGHTFNFVLINRYKDGSDHISEHRDDEKDLVKQSPIASLTLGQQRDFIFKHADSRGKDAKRTIAPVKIELEHGGLLMMNYPTNVYWYHSLPPRKRLKNVRINMTFRQMVTKPVK